MNDLERVIVTRDDEHVILSLLLSLWSAGNFLGSDFRRGHLLNRVANEGDDFGLVMVRQGGQLLLSPTPPAVVAA